MLCHVDGDSFFASVLQRKHPRLKGKPLLALGMGGGCVIAASYEAKRMGVKTGMTLKEALGRCPKAQHMPSDFGETALASEQIAAILAETVPTPEQYSIDEWFLDLRTLPGGIPFDPFLWAKDLQEEIRNGTDLTVSIGLAPSKTLAKMGSDFHKPAGITYIEKRDIERFLADLPCEAIPGIGRARSVHAKARRWTTAWDIATADREVISRLFGKPGLELQRELLGERVYPVIMEDSPPQSISRCRSFRATKDNRLLWAHVLQHLSYTLLKLRTQDLACRGVSLWLRDGAYRMDGLRTRLPQPMDTEESMTPHLRGLFDRLARRRESYTQTGLCLWDLVPKGGTQFSLFESPTRRIGEEDLQKSLDRLRKKFGRDVVMRGSAMPVWERKKKMLDLPFFD